MALRLPRALVSAMLARMAFSSEPKMPEGESGRGEGGWVALGKGGGGGGKGDDGGGSGRGDGGKGGARQGARQGARRTTNGLSSGVEAGAAAVAGAGAGAEARAEARHTAIERGAVGVVLLLDALARRVVGHSNGGEYNAWI